MEQIRIDIPEETVNYIQSLSYEIEARKEIISFMLSQDTERVTTFDSFKNYHDEYTRLKTEYELAKMELQNTYVLPKVGDRKAAWLLDYNTHIATITFAED